MLNRIVLVVALALATPALAHAKPNFRTGASLGTVVGFPESGPDWRPLTIIIRAGVGVPIRGPWGWTFEVGMKTPFTIFNPAPQITTGPTVKLTSKLALALTILGRYTPNYGKGSSWLLAATIGPAYAATPWLSLGLGVGGGAAFASGKPPVPEVDVVWSQTFSF